MDPQWLYDVAYSVKLVGKRSVERLEECMLLQSGKRVSAAAILECHDRLVVHAAEKGYSDPLGFMEDYFAGRYHAMLPVGTGRIERGRLQDVIEACEGPTTQDPASLALHFDICEKAPERMQDAGRVSSSGSPMVAARGSSDTAESGPGSPLEIPQDMRSKILKPKKGARYYREMPGKAREVDNRFDYVAMQAQRDESGKFSNDNREAAAAFPLIGASFSDIDVDFRKIMARVYEQNRGLVKDKSRWTEEISALSTYFARKLGIEPGDDSSGRRLATAVAYLMKKLQTKIFDTNDQEALRVLVYFKTQLGVFYNFYRK